MKFYRIFLFVTLSLLISIIIYITIDNYKLNKTEQYYKGLTAGVVLSVDNTLTDILELEGEISNTKDSKQLELLLYQWKGLQKIAQNHLMTVSAVIPVNLFSEFMPFHNKLMTYLRDYSDATSAKARTDIAKNIKAEIESYHKFMDSIYIFMEVEDDYK